MRLLAVACLLALLAPSALADHVYSHRYVLEGRLVGSDGVPLPGRLVEFFSDGEDFLEPCRDGPHQSVTDEWGDFRFCFHHHELAPGTSVGVRSGNASVERPADAAMRRTVVTLREPNETGVAPANWSSTYRISGRAWQVGPTSLEDVEVYGVALIGLPVNLTVHGDDGSEQRFQTVTDGFGDFDLVVETPGTQDVSLSVEATGRPQPVHFDALSHRTFVPVYLPGAAVSGTRDDGFGGVPPAPSQAPGSATPRVNPVLVVAVALGFVAAVLLSRRKS